jgi:hypothetical protein
MAQYTLHLGYNWNSPRIGSIWTPQSLNNRFLQYALSQATDTGTDEPAWFNNIQSADVFSIQLWDLSSSPAPIPSAWVLKLGLSNVSAVQAGTAATYDPSTYMAYPDTASVQPLSLGSMTSHYLEISSFDLSYSRSDSYSGPWGPCRGRSGLYSPLSFTPPEGTLLPFNFELSFALEVTVTSDGDRVTQVFLSDPEVIVGSMG